MEASGGLTDECLYERGMATLVASWEEYAKGSPRATLLRLSGVAVALFPNEPERAVYNNALVARGLGPAERAAALGAMEATYEAARIQRFAVWVHECDIALQRDLRAHGYKLQESTRAMGITLDEDAVATTPEVDLGPSDWLEYLRIVGVPPDFLSRADRAAYRILIARLDGVSAAAAMAFDFCGDCGIYNVGTLEHARRRGLASGLTLLHLHAAFARGCRTASLQATPLAERLYAALGFRDLGKILEYAPPEKTNRVLE